MMVSRGLPLSFLVHALALVLLIVYGNKTAQQVVQPPRSINVKLVQLPQTRPVEQAPPRPEPEPVRQEEVVPELPPKELPEKKPEPREKKPDPKPEVRREEKPAEPVDREPTETEPAPQATLSSPSVTATDSDFPFAWYISLIESKIVANWQPRQLGFGSRAIVSCTVHFNIARNGRVTQVTLVRNSGVGVYDREALRAVQTSRLPPLPPDYRASELGVTFVFNLEPGS